MSADQYEKKPPEPQAPIDMTGKSAEEIINVRLCGMQVQLDELVSEVRTLRGRFGNRDPEKVATIQKENDRMKTRIKKLEKALFALILDSMKGREKDIAKLQYEVLHASTVDFCKRARIDFDIWKNIAS